MSEAMLDFDCPRCGSPVSERLYGPCAPCRDTLRATLGREPAAAGEAASVAFEPKLNVVPNHVATKD